MRFLIVVFDALRPEFVTPDLMPNLHGFASTGVLYPNSRSTFLTETRVNQTAVVTGCTPARNGIVANVLMARDVWPDRVLNSGKEAELKAAFAAADGRLIQVPTLSERAAAAGRTYASLSAGTPGGGRLINHSAEDNGSFRFAMRSPEASVPSGVREDIEAAIGPMPAYERPATQWISWAVNAYTVWVQPRIAPDVMLLWLCEPDETFHYCGIGSPESLVTIRHADAEFGRLLDSLKDQMESGDLQIIAMSDHGQISLEGAPLDIPARLRDAGFRAAKAPAPDVDCVVVVHNGGGIWVREDDPRITSDLVRFLLQEPWCGPIFTRDGVQGTLRLADVCLDHARAPTIAVTMRTRDGSNEWNRAGKTFHDAPYPTIGGCHGGLSRYELNNFLSMSGGAFKTGIAIEAPAGNIDITPTICHLLGIDGGADCDGRILHEALHGTPNADSDTWQETVRVSQNSVGPRTHLSFTEFGATRYLNGAWLA